MKKIMKILIKGILFFLSMTGLLFNAPGKAVAIVQAPTWSVSVGPDESEKCGGEITLLKNPLYEQMTKKKRESEDRQKTEQKVAFLLERHSTRLEEEKEERRLLRKKKLAEKKRREEEKRRKEILACCGVSAGSNDRKILERIVEAEAGGENIHGRLLVANVILNRVRHKEFPSSIEGVVFSHRGSRYQFSPISDGRYYSVTVSEGTKKAVDLALHGKDFSEGALYFMERAYAKSSNARWFDRSLKRLFRYGCHEFFK